MVTEAARENEFWCEDKSRISDCMTQSASSGCPSSSAHPFVRRPPQTGLHCSPLWCFWGLSQSPIVSLNACPEFTPSYFCFWVTEITSAQPPEADCSVGCHILAPLEPWAGAAHSREAQTTSPPPASRAQLASHHPSLSSRVRLRRKPSRTRLVTTKLRQLASFSESSWNWAAVSAGCCRAETDFCCHLLATEEYLEVQTNDQDPRPTILWEGLCSLRWIGGRCPGSRHPWRYSRNGWTWHLVPWSSWQGGYRSKVGPDGFGDPFQPKWGCDSVYSMGLYSGCIKISSL